MAAASCGGTAAPVDVAHDAAVELPYDPAAFTANACATPVEFNPFIDVTPASPVDYVGLRVVSRDWENPFDPYFRYGSGTPCATATDVPACEAALAALPESGSWTYQSHVDEPPSSGQQFAYTRGDVVGALTTHAELLAFLGPIDSIVEATLVVKYGESPWLSYYVDCKHGNARAVDGGFELLVNSEEEWAGFCPTVVRENHFFVATDGTVTLLNSRELVRYPNGC